MYQRLKSMKKRLIKSGRCSCIDSKNIIWLFMYEIFKKKCISYDGFRPSIMHSELHQDKKRFDESRAKHFPNYTILFFRQKCIKRAVLCAHIELFICLSCYTSPLQQSFCVCVVCSDIAFNTVLLLCVYG